MSVGRPAAFLDRDGTLIRDDAYIGDPARVVLVPGAAAALKRLNAAGVPVVVVTNQSGIARGLFSEHDYRAVSARLDTLLAAEGAHIDATYMCPHHPDVGGPCECRKPGLQLYRKAAVDLHLDPTRSAFIGDRWRDTVPAIKLGGLGILVPATSTPAGDFALAAADGILSAQTLGDAVTRFLATLPAPGFAN